MLFIINSTEDETKRTYEEMTGVGSPNWDVMPSYHNPHVSEDRILCDIEENSERTVTGRQLSTWIDSNRSGNS